MADTVLDKYNRRQAEFEKEFRVKGATMSGLLMYQELLYRTCVLSTLQMFTLVAPVGDKFEPMLAHYKMLDGYIEGLIHERQFGVPANDDLLKNRKAAQDNLLRVVWDYRKRFSSFKPSAPDLYRREIENVIMTILPAWISYRNVYVSLKQTEEAA